MASSKLFAAFAAAAALAVAGPAFAQDQSTGDPQADGAAVQAEQVAEEAAPADLTDHDAAKEYIDNYADNVQSDA
ncbi:MAG: hypothetical protein IKO40_10910, partial [Kiritimatiellae bacterium]|nr:hypothetical protein [Kiritimatiellia bacterium]